MQMFWAGMLGGGRLWGTGVDPGLPGAPLGFIPG